MKDVRQAAILEIVASQQVETQDQLLHELNARGFHITQATISRDIRELHLHKEAFAPGHYRYTQNSLRGISDLDTRLRNIFREGVLSVEVAQNIVVVKTMPGLASAACSALDGMNIAGMVGSLAGDDTGVLIMKDHTAAMKFDDEIRGILDRSSIREPESPDPLTAAHGPGPRPRRPNSPITSDP